jgi:hypothetical protein
MCVAGVCECTVCVWVGVLMRVCASVFVGGGGGGCAFLFVCAWVCVLVRVGGYLCVCLMRQARRYRYKGGMQCISRVIRTEGFAALYNGAQATQKSSLC